MYILKLTKVKAFIQVTQTFIVRWLVSAKTPSPFCALISQLNYSLLVFIATKGWIWWVHSFRWLDKPSISLSSHTILIGSVPRRGGWYHALSCNCKLCQVSFNKTIHLNDVIKTEAYYTKLCFQSLILLGFQKKSMRRHVYIAMSVLQSYYCSHYYFLNSYPFHHCLAFTCPADITHPLSFCFSNFLKHILCPQVANG